MSKTAKGICPLCSSWWVKVQSSSMRNIYLNWGEMTLDSAYICLLGALHRHLVSNSILFCFSIAFLVNKNTYNKNLWVFFSFLIQSLLGSPGWPVTCFVDQAALKLTNIACIYPISTGIKYVQPHTQLRIYILPEWFFKNCMLCCFLVNINTNVK